MSVYQNNDLITVIDFEDNLSVGNLKATTHKGIWLGFDNGDNPEFEPKALIYFSEPSDIDLLIAVLKKAQKKFKNKKHYPETDNVPNGK